MRCWADHSKKAQPPRKVYTNSIADIAIDKKSGENVSSTLDSLNKIFRGKPSDRPGSLRRIQLPKAGKVVVGRGIRAYFLEFFKASNHFSSLIFTVAHPQFEV